MTRVCSTCVWETTLACNLRCIHCGSDAGRARDEELSTDEALNMIAELARLGCRSLTLSGGEPLLRRDWPSLAAAVRREGMRLEMITNGLLVSEQADAIAEAGFFGVTFSLDGPPPIHDHLRGREGALSTLLRGAAALKERGVRIGAATQVNKLNLSALEETFALLLAHRFDGWQVQLTMPLGRAADGDALCLSPQQLPTLEARLLELIRRRELFIQGADNIGYMSRNELILRRDPRVRSSSTVAVRLV